MAMGAGFKGEEIMWWVALAKAIQGTQDAMRQQDMRRKQAAYSTEASLPIENEAVQFGMNPSEGKSMILKAPGGTLDEEENVSEFY